MLSRVANRLYWLSRYLERAECTARLLASYSQFVLDAPSGSELGWDVLVRIIEADDVFAKRFKQKSERNVIKFMLIETKNTGSIYNSLTLARENNRTTRGVLPGELWELINELYWFVAENVNDSIDRKARFHFLEEIIARNQQINGLVSTSLARDDVFRFLKFGQLIERCDMTTRIIDVGTAAIRGKQAQEEIAIPQLWTSILKSLSALGSYQREIGPIVTSEEVINFVMRSEAFPRSLHYCMSSMLETLKPLKNSAGTIAPIQSVVDKLDSFIADDTDMPGLHDFIDLIQARLIETDNEAFKTWYSVA